MTLLVSAGYLEVSYDDGNTIYTHDESLRSGRVRPRANRRLLGPVGTGWWESESKASQTGGIVSAAAKIPIAIAIAIAMARAARDILGGVGMAKSSHRLWTAGWSSSDETRP